MSDEEASEHEDGQEYSKLKHILDRITLKAVVYGYNFEDLNHFIQTSKRLGYFVTQYKDESVYTFSFDNKYTLLVHNIIRKDEDEASIRNYLIAANVIFFIYNTSSYESIRFLHNSLSDSTFRICKNPVIFLIGYTDGTESTFDFNNFKHSHNMHNKIEILFSGEVNPNDDDDFNSLFSVIMSVDFKSLYGKRTVPYSSLYR